MVFADIESIVFSRLKNAVNKKLKKKYPDLSFTTSNKIGSNVKYPYVYVHLMDSPERGNNLEGDIISGVYASFQIEVNDLESQERAKDVAFCITEEMKKMRFQTTMFPYANNTDSNFRVITRFRRTIAQDDVL